MQVNPSSLWKIMDLIGRLSKKPLKVTFEGQVKVYAPLPLVIAQNLSLKDYECQKCGQCCAGIRHDLFWLKKPEGIKVKPAELKVDGRSKTIYFYRNGNKLCTFFKNNLCSIQVKKPLHCLMSFLKVDEWQGKYYLQKRLYRDFPCEAETVYKVCSKEDSKVFNQLKEEAKTIGITLRKEVL